MKNVDINDLPPNGSRQDMTITKIGLNPNDEPVIVCEIDNGEFMGHKVSHKFRNLDKLAQTLTSHWSIKESQLDSLRGDRFSASVHWKEFTSSNGSKGVGYKLSHFSKPEGVSMIDDESFSFVRS